MELADLAFAFIEKPQSERERDSVCCVQYENEAILSTGLIFLHLSNVNLSP